MMKKVYDKFCSIETSAAICLLIASVFIIFISAILRTVRHPVSWGTDMALFMFTWSTLLSADIAFRSNRHVVVDILVSRLPEKVRRFFTFIVYLIMVAAIVFMFYYGLQLTIKSHARVFQGIPGLSYSYVAASMPVSMFFMLITALKQMYTLFIKKEKLEETQEN